jgi:hypothetical protein
MSGDEQDCDPLNTGAAADFIANCAGPIWGMAWCPGGKDQRMDICFYPPTRVVSDVALSII